MTHTESSPNRDVSDELGALRAIVEGTACHTGQEFFQSLVRHLAAAVGTRYAFVAEFAGGTRARTLAFWFRDHIADNIEWDVTGTPCELGHEGVPRADGRRQVADEGLKELLPGVARRPLDDGAQGA